MYSSEFSNRESGMVVKENFGTIESFEKTPAGIRMNFSKDGKRDSAEATLVVVVAVGWVADSAGLNLAAAGVELNQRKFVKVDEYLRTSAPHIFSAGDITGRLMLVPQGVQAGFVAATNAVLGPTMPLGDEVTTTGNFTEPEYAQTGLSEAKARTTHDIVTRLYTSTRPRAPSLTGVRLVSAHPISLGFVVVPVLSAWCACQPTFRSSWCAALHRCVSSDTSREK